MPGVLSKARRPSNRPLTMVKGAWRLCEELLPEPPSEDRKKSSRDSVVTVASRLSHRKVFILVCDEIWNDSFLFVMKIMKIHSTIQKFQKRGPLQISFSLNILM